MQKLLRLSYLWEFLRNHWPFLRKTRHFSKGALEYTLYSTGPCLQLRCRPRENHKNHKTVFNGWPSCKVQRGQPWLARLQTRVKSKGRRHLALSTLSRSWRPGPWLCCERHPRVDRPGQSRGSTPGPRHCKFNTGTVCGLRDPASPARPHAETGRHGHCSS